MMIEERLLNFLKDRFDIPVCYEVPDGPPDIYIMLQKAGSFNKDRLDEATFAIQSIAPTRLEAMELNHLVKETMEDFVGLAGISRCHCNGDYDFTNTQTKERRYQAVYNITYKE